MANRRSLSFGQFSGGEDAQVSIRRLRQTESRMQRSREWDAKKRAEQEQRRQEQAREQAAKEERLRKAEAAKKAELARSQARREAPREVRRDRKEAEDALPAVDYTVPTRDHVDEEPVVMSRSEFVSAMQEAMTGALREKEARDEARKDPANWTAQERYEYRKQAFKYAVDRICDAHESGRYDAPYYEPLVFAAGTDLTDDDLPVTFNKNAPAYQRWLGTPAYHRFCWRHDLADGITSPDDVARDAYRQARDTSPIGYGRGPASQGPNPADYGCDY